MVKVLAYFLNMRRPMMIKELSNKYKQCCDCPFEAACDVLNCNSPEWLDDTENELVTKSIIETAKILQEGDKSKVEKEIREGLNRLTTYRLPNSNTDLVTLKSVQRVLNLILRGSRESEVDNNG